MVTIGNQTAFFHVPGSKKIGGRMTIPKHLRPATRKWVKAIADQYELEPHHEKLLTLAAEAWDRCVAAREAIDQHGITYVDRFGQVKARPEVGIERDARVGFARTIREIGLDLQPPPESRPRR